MKTSDQPHESLGVMDDASGGGLPRGAKEFFAPTIWSTVLKAREGDEPSRMAALDRLFTRYRKPILLEIQFRCHSSQADAEDIAHEFIATWLRRDFLREVDPSKGRFRTFVKVCIHNFLEDLRARQHAAKRGGGVKHVSWCEFLEHLPDHQPPPGLQTDRAWASHILELCLHQLRKECADARRDALFVALKPLLAGEPDAVKLNAVAASLGMSDGAVRMAARRMRDRLGEIIADEVRETVSVDEDWQDELRYLISLLGQ